MVTETLSHQGRIDRLEIENFKSYRGSQKIGPFKNFTAIIGPNGSGKSNLMDAISFVLGVRTAQLRGSLKELLYSNTDGNSELDRPRKGLVTLVFETPNGSEMRFSRVIVPSSNTPNASYSSQYKIDNHVVSWDTYNKQLENFGILVKARNFLVFQGDIEHVAAMSPKDLANMFEHISGSEALRKDYEELELKKAEAEEKQSFVFSKKKTIAQEKKQKKEQRDEAEKHVKLQQELEQMKIDYYVWQIYHIDRDMKRAKQEKGGLHREVTKTEAALQEVEAEIDGQKKKQALLAKERLLIERKVNKRRAEIDKQNPEAVKLREETNRLMKKLKSDEKMLETKRKQHETQQQKLAKLQAELEGIQTAQAELEEEHRQQQQAGKLEFSDELLAEYHRIKAEAGAKTSKLYQDKIALESALQADEEAMRNLEDEMTAINNRLEQIETELSSTQAQCDSTAATREEARQLLENKATERRTIADNNRKTGAQREYYEKKVEEIEAQLREAKADRKENERDRRMAEAVQQMKQLFPGVHGRVSDLAQASQRKYNMALTVLVGKAMDNVVVETEQVARECIQYLRQHHIAPMSFIPLQGVRAKPVSERLRQLGGTAKLALDVLQFDPKFDRAFLTICGNALVCDTVEEARRLAYNSSEKHKVASLDGTYFQKGGAITGGISVGLEARASRWDDKAMDALQKEHSRYVHELQQLGSTRDGQQLEQALNAEILGLENRIKLATDDINRAQHKITRLQAEAQTLKASQQSKQPDIDKLHASIQSSRGTVDQLATRINDITDKLFKAFSKKVGVANIREYEENVLRKAEEIQHQRTALARQVAALESEFQFESRNDLVQPIKKLESDIKKHKEKLAHLQEQEAQAEAAREAVEAELTQELERAAALRVQCDEVEARIREHRKAATAQQAEVAKAQRAVNRLIAALEQLQSKRHDVLEAAAMDQVVLPTTGQGSDPNAEDDDDDDGMEVDDEGGEEDQDDTVTGHQAIDFSKLKRQYLATTGTKDREKLDEQFRNTIDELAQKLAKVAPNLKAFEQYDAVREKEREQQAELDVAKAEAQEATRKFNDVRQRRYDAFMQAFEHISGTIDAIYKELTRSPLHPIGGTAYLSVENTDEPFLHGIKFTAMPPTKRFRDMEQLSGGEKTVAALALLFAVHSFQPSPFFVLDEVDAALDATNVARVAHYIRAKTRSGAEGAFQSIVISLKDHFYEKADGLVGVCRDNNHGCSATYTFDLSRFD